MTFDDQYDGPDFEPELSDTEQDLIDEIEYDLYPDRYESKAMGHNDDNCHDVIGYFGRVKMNHEQNRISAMAQDWIEQVDHIGPFAPLMQLQQVYDQAPDDIFNTQEYWYISGLLQGRKGYQPLPDADITAEQHLDVLEMIAENPGQHGMEMAQQAAGLRDGYSIALGYYGDPRD